jgi:hypothetical protein
MRKSIAAAGLGMLVPPLLLVAMLHLLLYVRNVGEQKGPRVRASMQALITVSSTAELPDRQCRSQAGTGWQQVTWTLRFQASLVM